jgi:hypothetical protein
MVEKEVLRRWFLSRSDPLNQTGAPSEIGAPQHNKGAMAGEYAGWHEHTVYRPCIRS